MSFDQCMNCTRYEPIIGQVYEILNETGLNLSEVLDECQLGYMTTDDYIHFAKPEKLQEDLPIVSKVGYATRQVRDANYAEKDFSEQWPGEAGIVMNWNLVPVEDQKPSINDSAAILSSNVGTKTNSGSSMVSNQAVGNTSPSNSSNKLLESAKKLDSLTENSFGYNLVLEADEWLETYKDVYLKDMNRTLCSNVTELLKEKKMEYLDNLLVCAIVCASNRDANTVISDLDSIYKSLKSKNINNDVLAVLFHNLDRDTLFGSNPNNIEDKTFPRRLDKVTKIVETESNGGE